MTFIIKKSIVDSISGFEVLAAAHAKEMRDWMDREVHVARDAKNPNVKDADRWVSCPKPEAPNGYVASAVNENGIADYEIENDDPTPSDLLPGKKVDLTNRLHAAENDTIEAVLPNRKRPLRNLRYAEIIATETDLRKRIFQAASDESSRRISDYNDAINTVLDKQKGLLAKVASAIGVSDTVQEKIDAVSKPEPVNIDLEDEVKSIRSKDDHDFLEETASINKAMENIARAVAVALSEIEELTVDTVDAYQLPDLKNL